MTQALLAPGLRDGDLNGLQRSSRTVLFADVVDSVRLIEADEENTIRRWLELADGFGDGLARSGAGRLVKRMGDGVLAEFWEVADAVEAALALQRQISEANEGVSRDARLEIRIGIDLGDVLQSRDEDIYGQHVNIAARLAAAARPGQIMATAPVRDAAASSRDAEFEDLGPLFLKNVAQSVHAYLVLDAREEPQLRPHVAAPDLLPTIAVLPMATRGRSAEGDAWGDMLTDDLIAALSRSSEMNVISRLSTTGFRAGQTSIKEIRKVLNADFVLSGTFHGDGQRIALDIELTEVHKGMVVWSDRVNLTTAELLTRNAIFSDLAAQIHGAMLKTEMRRALTNPLPTLEGFAMLMASVALMHRLSRRDFTLAEEILDTLIANFPGSPAPLAWKSRWHVLRVQQGWSDDLQREANMALDCTQRALDLDPENVAALIAEGFVRNNLLHDLDEAEDLYDSALEHNPSDATGRVLRGTLYAFRGEGRRAVQETERALHLAPLDPNRFFFYALAAGASLADEDYPRALDLAKGSLRLNRSHTSTLRIKAVAELRMGLADQARATAGRLLKLQPKFSIGGWQKNSPSAAYPVGRKFADSLREIGVPD